MKTSLSSIQHVAFLALALGTVSITSTFAQTPPATPSEEKHGHDSVLTPAEKAQIQKAHDAAIAADPTLKTDEDALKQKHDALHSQGSSASADDKAAFHQQAHDFKDKMRAAELKIDPTLAPIFAKLDATHGHHHE